MSAIYKVKVDRIFARALELEGREQAAYLSRTCAGRPDLRAAVDELLSLSNTDDDLLDGAPDLRTGWLRAAETTFQGGLEGHRMGSWKLVREIGRGGMGVVYLAQRAAGDFEQQAALKLVQLDSGSRRLARFHQERQILADLDHPGIARLLDGGLSDDNRQYLAMEYVDGERIDVFCERQGLSIRARLAIFLDVCAAVDAAHRQLVVHRDLKPSNILVTAATGGTTPSGATPGRAAPGRVKLLDFGIAKLLSGDKAISADVTKSQVHAMTPAYASPEQLLGETVTVASDVYQLGLLLFLLLTGRLPYDLNSVSLPQAQRLVCKVPAPRASSAVTQTEAEAASLGARLRRELRGDLDSLIAKALEKQPAKRYASVDALAADVRRYLRGLPIEARPATWHYRGAKFVARHRLAVAAALVALLLGVTYTARLRFERDLAEAARIEAEQARDESRELSRLLVEGRLEEAAEVLEDVFERQQIAAAEPLEMARTLCVLGVVYADLGRYERAARTLEQALDFYTAESRGESQSPDSRSSIQGPG